MHTVWCSRMGPVASLWRGFRCCRPGCALSGNQGRGTAVWRAAGYRCGAVTTLRAGAGGGLSAGGNLNRWSVHPGPGRQEGPRQAPTDVCDGAAGLRFLAIPAPFRCSMHTVWCSRMGPVASLWRGFRCAVPVVLCPAIRAEALPFGERQVDDAVTTLRAGAGGGLSAGGSLNCWSPAPAPGPWEEKRRAASERHPEPLVTTSRSWTPGGSSAGANRRLRWGGPVCGSWPSPCGSGARCTPSGVHGWVLWRACGEGPGVDPPPWHGPWPV